MTGFDARMQQLRARFIARMIEERELLIAAMICGDWEATKHLAHGLSGSAGVFGFPEISLCAQALEEGVDDGFPDRRLRELGSRLTDQLGGIEVPD